MPQRIFIGSSSESLIIARRIHEIFTNYQNREPTVWDDGIFGLTQPVLVRLIDRLDKSDAAIFVLSPDDITTLRGSQYATVRDNVIFELGLFIGRLGPERTFFVVPKDQKDLHLPSDLLGITYASYDANRSDKNLLAALRPACDQIERDMVALEQKDSGIEPTPEGFRTKLGRTVLKIRFGRIERSESRELGFVVALPATEFFEVKCASDVQSALGAYLNESFPGRLKEVQGIISDQLKNEKSEPVERERGRRDDSFGVGRCIYLHNMLGSDRDVILVSVTTKRAGEGIRCEPYALFAALHAICQTMNDYRLDHLELPVMGSGHGGMSPELALFYLILATRAVTETHTGRHLKSVSIVVFQKDPASEPSIPRDTVAQILSFAKANL
jgi:hypothetical protein